MRITTLCYVERAGRLLMLHRVKKDHDENAGKWIGIGGHLEGDESPEECVRREALEETGLRLTGLHLRGVITFILPDWGNELTFLYTAGAEGEPPAECPEGVLKWVSVSDVPGLPLWEGDRVFLPLIARERPVFSLKLVYAPGGALKEAVLDGVPLDRSLWDGKD